MIDSTSDFRTSANKIDQGVRLVESIEHQSVSRLDLERGQEGMPEDLAPIVRNNRPNRICSLFGAYDSPASWAPPQHAVLPRDLVASQAVGTVRGG